MLEALRQRLTLDGNDARALLQYTFKGHSAPKLAVRLWDGQELSFAERPEFTLAFGDPETFRRCFASRDPARFAEAYVEGRLGIEGDLWEATGLGSYLRTANFELGDKLRFAPKLLVPASPHTPERDRMDVKAHYDLSDDFFRLFLDQKMVYSCAYFETPEQGLEQAQERKLELICKKLALAPGDTFLDVGCGWGALVTWAARHHGVRAHGITLSEHQAAEARRRISKAGLSDVATIKLGHYQDLPTEAFDKIASVGMYEHVGEARLPEYLGSVQRALRPGGLFLNHGITEPSSARGATGGTFIYRRVFPGAALASVARLQAAMETTGFEILDVQGLREHYALTLREWFRRFQRHRNRAERLVPEPVLRIWDLYLPGCAHAFEDGVLGIHQVLAGKPDANGRVRGHFTREQMAHHPGPIAL